MTDTTDNVTLDDGTECRVLRRFGDARAIVDMGGAFVVVDKLPVGPLWTQSGEPARGAEIDALKELLAPTNDTTVVTVTKE